MKKAYLIAFLVIGAAMGFTLWAFSSSMTPYVDIATAEKSDSPVQVRGKILHDTARYDSVAGALRFFIQDDKGAKVEVVYRRAKPDSFDSAPETAARGIYRKGVFEADDLVVKCPSKYDDSKSAYRQAATPGGYK